MALGNTMLETKVAALTQVHKHLIPGVIDMNMITRHVYEQGPKGEAGRIAGEEGLEFDEVTSLTLEYLRIFKIDHLWVLPNLTKLQLNNNSIESIDNLHMLVHLRELDLSFNHIRVIENLEELGNLEILYLYQNHISQLENLEAQQKLCILSAGNNELEDREASVLYLRRLPKLKSLNISGNPMCESDNFREYVLAFLPNMVYYEYALVEDDIRISSQTLFMQELTLLKRDEEALRAQKEAAEREAAEVELHSVSFVERLNGDQLFRAMFENDPDGQALVKMNEETKEFFETSFGEEFTSVCRELFLIGQEQYLIRKREYDDFQSCVSEAKEKSQLESQSALEAFLEQKQVVFSEVQALLPGLHGTEEHEESNQNEFLAEAALVISNASLKFNQLIQSTWHKLMSVELTVSEQMEDVNTTLERDMSDMVNGMLEQTLGFFVEMRTLQEAFNEQLTEVSHRYQMLALDSDDSSSTPNHLQEIMADKESLSNALANSHEIHLMVIDAREDTLVTRIRAWHEDVCESLQKKEIARNRKQVLEINHFLDLQKEEFEELLANRPEGLVTSMEMIAGEQEGSEEESPTTEPVGTRASQQPTETE